MSRKGKIVKWIATYFTIILPGYLFAGLQHADRKCWCGSILDQSARLEDHSCKTNCSEDHALGCNHTQEVVKVFGTSLPGNNKF